MEYKECRQLLIARARAALELHHGRILMEIYGYTVENLPDLTMIYGNMKSVQISGRGCMGHLLSMHRLFTERREYHLPSIPRDQDMNVQQTGWIVMEISGFSEDSKGEAVIMIYGNILFQQMNGPG